MRLLHYEELYSANRFSGHYDCYLLCFRVQRSKLLQSAISATRNQQNNYCLRRDKQMTDTPNPTTDAIVNAVHSSRDNAIEAVNSIVESYRKLQLPENPKEAYDLGARDSIDTLLIHLKKFAEGVKQGAKNQIRWNQNSLKTEKSYLLQKLEKLDVENDPDAHKTIQNRLVEIEDLLRSLA